MSCETDKGFAAVRLESDRLLDHVSDAARVGTDCYHYAELPDGRSTFRLVIRLATPPDSGVTMRIATADSAAIRIESTEADRHEPGSYSARVLVPAVESRGARVLMLAGENVVGVANLYLARRPDVRFTRASPECGDASVCLIPRVENHLRLSGSNLAELDDTREVSVVAGSAAPLSVRLRREGDALFLPVRLQEHADELLVRVPVKHPVLHVEGDRREFRPYVMVRVPIMPPAGGTTPSASFLEASTNQTIDRLFTGDLVRARVALEHAAPNVLSRGTLVDVLDRPGGEGAVRLAVVEPLTTANGEWIANLQALAASVRSRPSQATPFAYLKLDESTFAPVPLDVRPAPRVERVTVERDGLTSDGAVLRPDDSVTVHVAGPSVDVLDVRAASGSAVQAGTPDRGRDVMSFRVVVPKVVRAFEDLLLFAPGGIDTTLRFTIQQPQRTRPIEDFVSVRWAARTPTDQQRSLWKRMWGHGRNQIDGDSPLRPYEELAAQSLEAARLSLDAERIDQGRLHGVQYLVLDVSFFDHVRDAPLHTETRRIAVVPAGSPFARYTVQPGYEPVTQLELDDVLGGLTRRGKPHSQVRVRVRHDETQHAGQASAREVRLTQTGRFVVNPSLSLPSGLVVFQRGPKLTPSFSGGFADVRHYRTGSSRPTSVGFRLGLIVLRPDFLPDDAPGRDNTTFAPTALFDYRLATIREDVSITAAAGALYLNSTRRFYTLVSPGIQYSF